MLGANHLYEKGGLFNFKVSYISMSGVESELSNPFPVTVKANPSAAVHHVQNVTKEVHHEAHSKVQNHTS